MSSKLKPYVEAIQQSKEETEASLAPARAVEAEAALNMEQAQLGLKISKAKSVIADAAGKYPLNVKAILDAKDDLALLERQALQMSELRGELFPSKK